mmetsp:Transcript_44399/g.128480  ORF Transcript_44399/g.128480 Transcript_44399/m.128480 type:complete len:1076 (-) Transcript_44399:33-3260(-)
MQVSTLAMNDILSWVVGGMAPMWVEVSFLVFFTLGFTTIPRLRLFAPSLKARKLASQEAQFSPQLKRAIEVESVSAGPAAVLKAWRAGKNHAPTPFDLLKSVVQAFVDAEPSCVTDEITQHMQRHALVLKNSQTADAVLGIPARSGHIQVMLDLWAAFQKTLRIEPSYRMYETLLGGFAAVGDEKRVNETLEELKARNWKLTARGFSVMIKGFLKNNMVDAVLEKLLAMKKHGYLVPSFAVLQFVRIACEAGRISQVYGTIEANMSLQPDTVAHLLEDALRRGDVGFARRVEKDARESQKVPLTIQAYDPLLKLYAAQGDSHAMDLFKEMQDTGVHIGEGFCVGLLSKCAEGKFLRFAEEIMKFSRLRGTITIQLYSAFMKVYAYSGMYDQACDLYDQIREDGLEPDAMMYGCLMKFSAECGRTKLSQELSEKSPCMDIHNYMSLIRAAGRDKDVNQAFKVLRRLRESGVTLDLAAYNCVLDVCVSAGDMKRACALVEEMKVSSSLDIITYNTLIKGYCACGDHKGAKDLLTEMQMAGLQPNDVSYNCLVNAAVSSSDGDLREAWKTIELMEENGVAVDHYTISIMMKAMRKAKRPQDLAKVLALLDRTGIDICSDEILLNTVLETCISHREYRRLEEVLATYSRCGLRPSVHTYGPLIKACSTLQRIDRCWELWKEMEDRCGREPKENVLGCMLDALVCNERVDDAVNLFGSWKCRVTPNTVLYSTLIKGFANTHQSERAMAMWRDMRREGVKMNTVVYNAVIDAQARVGAMDAVSELVQAMEPDGCVLDVITYSTIVKGYCVKGDFDKAFELFRSIQKNGMTHDSVIYNTILNGCIRHSRFDLADQLLDDMERKKVVPSNFTIGIIVKMYGQRRMLDKAFEAFEQIPRRFGFRANVQARTCLMSACINNNAIARAFQVFEEMKRTGQGADFKAYRSLICSCVRHGEVDKAAALVEEACGLGAEGAGHARELGIGEETVEQLLRAFSQHGQMESKGIPLLERLRAAEVPISGRLLSSAMGGGTTQPSDDRGTRGSGKSRWSRPGSDCSSARSSRSSWGMAAQPSVGARTTLRCP